MNTFNTDFVYRSAEKQRNKAMATYTPAGKFWTAYMSVMTLIVGSGIGYWVSQ